MSQAYASNAESVKDFLKDYTDEQINTMADMVSNEQNLAMQEWRNKAEKIRAVKELTLEESGELLGGIVGIKGVGKGISKVKALYKKGQEAKKTAEELKKKVREAAKKAKEATEKIKKDLEDKTKSKSQKSKEDNDPENDEGDLDGNVVDADAAADPDADAAEQEGSKDVDDEEGDTKDTDADIGGTAGEDDSAIDFNNLDDVSTDTLRNFFRSRIGAGRDAIKQARERLKQNSKQNENKDTEAETDSGEPPSTEQELGGAEDTEEASSGVDLDDIFSRDLGGTEEGSVTLIPEALASIKISAPRIGDGDVEDILSRPTRTTLNPNEAPTQETDFGGDPEQDIDLPTSIGGETELQVYRNTAPTSYVEEGRTFQSGGSSAYRAAEGADLTADSLAQGGSSSLGSTVVTADRTFDIDTPQPDAPAPAPEPESTELDTLGGNAETGENALESITTTLEGGGAAALKTVGESLTTVLGGGGLGGGGLSTLLGKAPDVVAEPLVNQAPDIIASRVQGLVNQAPDIIASRVQGLQADIGESAGSLNEYASKIIGRIASRGANIRKIAESVYGKVKKTVTETPQESGGESKDDDEDGEEEDADAVVEDAADDVGSGVLDVALGSVPVLGEAIGIGYALYSGIEDLFGGSDSPAPPKTKTLGTTIAGGNPLDLGGDAMGSMLATGINTTESAIDQAGSLSF
jgi:hypothetical protein